MTEGPPSSSAETAMPGSPVLQAIGLARRFRDGPREVCPFSGLDLSLWPGESLAVVGPSGVGKSTLLHLLGGLDRPTEGQVRIDGRDVFGMSDSARTALRNRAVGFVYQFHHLLPECTALENVAMPLRIRRLAQAEALAAASVMLERVGLGHRLDHIPAKLSGGERQRVAIARALVTQPKIVLADEPTGNLDHQTAQQVFSLLLEQTLTLGAALVVVTHDLRLAAQCSRRLTLLPDAQSDTGAPGQPIAPEDARA
ncbi:MAG: ATP-binding cassette domain-containing protein [Betaproteobacteria bacterium]|nr:ATP-binding cassette domain-containing protein [Betaproteobacteria bacterium]